MRQLQTQKSSSIEVVLAKWIGIPLLVSGVAYASVKAFTEYSASFHQAVLRDQFVCRFRCSLDNASLSNAVFLLLGMVLHGCASLIQPCKSQVEEYSRKSLWAVSGGYL
jgi:hypothetical protein